MKKETQYIKKPSIRHIQFHRNGTLYIQFYKYVDPIEMATVVLGTRIRYDFEEKWGSKVIIEGILQRRTKIGIILSDWDIRRV